ncbi:MAG: TRAP transporter small permease [Desulfobacteraceae bacterium]|nr:TRAP transporter small permease [Desulfobacteraceae bacterium]
MKKKNCILIKLLDNYESYACQSLLACFVVLFFLKIFLGKFFQYSIPWSEELAIYLFVWFVFFGACYTCRIGAHNRLAFQFKILPRKMAIAIEVFADLIWIIFNCYFIYLSYKFILIKMNMFWKSHTIGIPMKYFYVVLPIAFLLMTIRVIQINYLNLIKGIDIKDVDVVEVEQTIESYEKEDKPI